MSLRSPILPAGMDCYWSTALQCRPITSVSSSDSKQLETRQITDASIMSTITDISFSREAWDKNSQTYEVIRGMPFNAELAAGALSEPRFKHYITQDAHYLIGFGRALTLAAAKAPDPDRIVQFAKSAEGAIVVERALHGSFFER